MVGSNNSRLAATESGMVVARNSEEGGAGSYFMGIEFQRCTRKRVLKIARTAMRTYLTVHWRMVEG